VERRAAAPRARTRAPAPTAEQVSRPNRFTTARRSRRRWTTCSRPPTVRDKTLPDRRAAARNRRIKAGKSPPRARPRKMLPNREPRRTAASSRNPQRAASHNRRPAPGSRAKARNPNRPNRTTPRPAPAASRAPRPKRLRGNRSRTGIKAAVNRSRGPPVPAASSRARCSKTIRPSKARRAAGRKRNRARATAANRDRERRTRAVAVRAAARIRRARARNRRRPAAGNRGPTRSRKRPA